MREGAAMQYATDRTTGSDMYRGRSCPPAGAGEATGRGHGLRATYNAGCRCEPCRAANREYERQRVRRRAAESFGVEPEWVDARRAREHVRSLMSSGPGETDGLSWRRVAALAGVAPSTVSGLLWGKSRGGGRHRRAPARRIHRSTEARLVAVRPTEADRPGGATVPAAGTWRMIDEMVAAGVPRARVAKALGHSTPKLQLSRRRVRLCSHRAVERLHWALWLHSAQLRRRCDCPLPEGMLERLEDPADEAA